MTNLIGQSLGRYHILEQLGEGGMAIVYKAFDTRLERDVAIKIIRKGAFPADHIERILKRFEREAKALARLSHPNIIKVLDYGEHEGSPYLVMEYLPSGTLKQKMGKPLPWQEAFQLLLPIAEALDYAHSQNMIHRDVKPANILLTQHGQPMLTDFGIAKVLDLEETLDLTGTSAAVGTPEYMAPEQATAKFVDHRADIYSLGVVLYEMVTGRKPFIADTPMAVLIKHATESLPRPKLFAPNLPDSVEKILLKALAKQPDNRYQDMNEMASDFKGLLNVKVSGESTDTDIRAKISLESGERGRAERKATLARTFAKSFSTLKSAPYTAKSFYKIAGVIGVVIIFGWVGLLAIPQFLSLAPNVRSSATLHPSAAINFTTSPMSSVKPLAATTYTPTIEPTATITVTPTDNFTQINIENIDQLRLKHSFDLNSGPISTITFSDNVQLIAAGVDDGTVVVFSIDTGTELQKFKMDNPIKKVFFSPNNTSLLILDGTANLNILSLADNTLNTTITLGDNVLDLSFLNNTDLVAVLANGDVWNINILNGDKTKNTTIGFEQVDNVRKARFDHLSSNIAYLKLRQYEQTNKNLLCPPHPNIQSKPVYYKYSYTTAIQDVIVYSLSDSAEEPLLSSSSRITWGSDTPYSNQLSFSAANNLLAFGMIRDDKKTVTVWDIQQNKILSEIVIKNPFSQDKIESSLLTCTLNPLPKFTYNTYLDVWHPMYMDIGTVELSPDGKYILVGFESRLSFYDISNSTLIQEFQDIKGKITVTIISINNQYVAFGNYQGKVGIYEILTEP